MKEASIKRRGYLETMEKNLDALIRKNTGIVPIADNCKITFNGMETPLGENDLWANTLYIQQRQVFTDIISGNVLLLGIATNEFQNFQGQPPQPVEGDNRIAPTYVDPFYALIVIRLHLTDGRILMK